VLGALPITLELVMIISASNVTLASTSFASSKREIRESLRTWVGETRPDFEGMRADTSLEGVIVSLSEAGQAALANATESGKIEALHDIDEAVESDPRTQLIKLIVELLTGKKISTLRAEDVMQSSATASTSYDPSAPVSDQAQPAGYGIEYDYHESYSESASMHFKATGVIRTADGKEVSFDLSLAMQHSYAEETNISLREGDAKKIDPLILNFSGTATQLTDQKFSFDLNADGNTEDISFVQGGGFLTLDRNNDGKVNDGSELFGPATGNGFAELQTYDEDGNLWIDENDSIYQQLRILMKGAGGEDIVTSLKQSHVGALYLGNVASPFDIKNAQNELQGQVRTSGVWLSEDGKAGSLQQIDLVA